MDEARESLAGSVRVMFEIDGEFGLGLKERDKIFHLFRSGNPRERSLFQGSVQGFFTRSKLLGKRSKILKLVFIGVRKPTWSKKKGLEDSRTIRS